MSFQDNRYRAGKVAAATFLALLGGELIGNPDRVTATFIAVLCCSPAVSIGLRQGITQLGASLVGGTLGVLCILAQVPVYLGVPIAVCLAVLSTAWSKFSKGTGVASFTALFVQLVPFGSPFETWWTRQEAVLLALVCAAIVNIFVSAAFYKNIFGKRLHKLEALIDSKLERALTEPLSIGATFGALAGFEAELEPALQELEIRRAWETKKCLDEYLAEARRLKKFINEIYRMGLLIEDHASLSVSDAAPLICWTRNPAEHFPEVREEFREIALRLQQLVKTQVKTACPEAVGRILVIPAPGC